MSNQIHVPIACLWFVLLLLRALCADAIQLADAADGLQYLHSNGIIHGDVKGENILVSNSLRGLVTNFYLARPVEVQTSTGLHGIGSSRWMSPEVLEGGPQSSSSDAWSYGMTIAEVRDGEKPTPVVN